MKIEKIVVWQYRLIGLIVGIILVILGPLIINTAWAIDLDEGIDELAKQLTKGAETRKRMTIAVAEFPDLEETVTNLGRYIAEGLSTKFSQISTFQVIERRRLAQVLAELKLGMSDLINPTKAKRLGQMTGVEVIAVGTISDLGSTVKINARLIEIESATALTGASVRVSKDPIVEKMLREGRTGRLIPSPIPDVALPQEGRPLHFPPKGGLVLQLDREFLIPDTKGQPQIRVIVHMLELSQQNEIVMHLSYQNVTPRSVDVVADGETFLIDDKGKRYGDVVNFAGIRSSEPTILQPGERRVASIQFPPLSMGATVVNIYSGWNGQSGSIILNGVDLRNFR